MVFTKTTNAFNGLEMNEDWTLRIRLSEHEGETVDIYLNHWYIKITYIPPDD